MKYTDAQLADLIKDPVWVDIGNLPSNFYPYNFGSLYIRPFNTKHLKLLSMAVVQKDIAYQIRAVDLAITQDVNELSIGDYFYILEWLKMYSTPKAPVVVTWSCPHQRLIHKETKEYISNAPDSLRAAAVTANPDDYDLEPCSTSNSEILHFTDLSILQLPEEGWDGLPEGFDFPRVKQLAEIREALKNPELNMLVGGAQWIAGETLKEKFDLLDNQPDLEMFIKAQAINDTVVHGINEVATLHCRTCEAEHSYTITIDTLSFFR